MFKFREPRNQESQYLFSKRNLFRISEDREKYVKKRLTISFNWFGQNTQVWIHFFKKFKLERKKIYNEADYRIRCNSLKSEEIINKILNLYEKSGNKV